jgi:hypothetical protein
LQKKYLQEEIGWIDYGGKHFESIFTRFYQGYILPKKFNIDKRRAHLSTLILTGELTRLEALEELKLPTYSPKLQEEDLEYLLEKLDISQNEFINIMNIPIVSHYEFGTEEKIILL